MDNQENLESIGEVTVAQPAYLFTINNAGEKLVEIDKTGNITYMKDPESLTEASRLFWESLQGDFMVIKKSLIKDTPNNMDLGKLVREQYNLKMDSHKPL